MEPDWNKLYLNLYAYADQLLKLKSWFRGKGTDSYHQGKQPHDYVQDAIFKYLSEPEKFDPSLRSLEGYLKKHIIRQAIGNDSKTVENRVSSDIFKNQYEESGTGNDLLDDILPFQHALFDKQMDIAQIMHYMSEKIKENPLLVKLFHGHCRDLLQRREVIREYHLSETEYDNGIRRLNTILKACAAKFCLEAPKRKRKKEK